VVLDHPVDVRLALQETVARVLPYQRQLRGKGAHALVLGLNERPQPRDVDMRVPEAEQRRRCRAVASLQERPQAIARRGHRGEKGLPRLLEIHDDGKVLQAGVDLGDAERVRIDVLADAPQRLDVDPQLVDFFMPDAERRVPHHGLGRRRLRHCLAARRRRPGVCHPRSVAGVGLDGHFVPRAWHARLGQRDLAVPAIPCARGDAVHIDGALAADVHTQGDAPTSGGLRQRRRAKEPGVLPLGAPRRAVGHRRPRPLHGLLHSELFRRAKALEKHGAQRLVELPAEFIAPGLDAVAPFQVQRHGVRLLCLQPSR